MEPKAERVLTNLLNNTRALAETYEGCKGSEGALDWERFADTVQQQDLVGRILGIGTKDIDDALAEVRAERKRLRDEWRGKTMPGEVIDRLSQLSDMGMKLADSKLDVGLTPAYVTWMMEQAKPLLERAALSLLSGR